MECSLPSEVSGAGCSLQWVSWAWGVGNGPDLGSLVLGLGRVGGAEEGSGSGRTVEILVDLRNFVRDDAYFGDGVTCESQERRCQTRLVMRAQAEMMSAA